jgi:hypothetical protein
MGGGKISGYTLPEIDPFQENADLFNRKVEEIFQSLKAKYPRNDERTLRALAEEMATPYAPPETGRPN